MQKVFYPIASKLQIEIILVLFSKFWLTKHCLSMSWPSERAGQRARVQAELQRILGLTPAQAGDLHSSIRYLLTAKTLVMFYHMTIGICSIDRRQTLCMSGGFTVKTPLRQKGNATPWPQRTYDTLHTPTIHSKNTISWKVTIYIAAIFIGLIVLFLLELYNKTHFCGYVLITVILE